MSAIANYIAGVLDRDSMVEIVTSLCAAADLRLKGPCPAPVSGSRTTPKPPQTTQNNGRPAPGHPRRLRLPEGGYFCKV